MKQFDWMPKTGLELTELDMSPDMEHGLHVDDYGSDLIVDDAWLIALLGEPDVTTNGAEIIEVGRMDICGDGGEVVTVPYRHAASHVSWGYKNRWHMAQSIEGPQIAVIDNDGMVMIEDGHTVAEVARGLFPDGPHPYQYVLTPGMLKAALDVTWNTRETREFWDAVRELLIERHGELA